MGLKDMIVKDLDKVSDEQLLNNYENVVRERVQYEKKVRHEEKLLDIAKRRLDLTRRMSAISDVKPHAIEPSHEFQRDEEWKRLAVELYQLNTSAKDYEASMDIEQREEMIRKANEELQRFEEAKPRLIAEMEKRGIKYDKK